MAHNTATVVPVKWATVASSFKVQGVRPRARSLNAGCEMPSALATSF